MEKLDITLVGLSPLLMNNPAKMLNMNAGKQTLGKKSIPLPKDEAEGSRYLLPDGHLYVPAIAVRNCFLSGTKGQLINRKSALPFISGGLLLIDEAFPLYRNGEPIGGDDYSQDIRRAVIQRQGITRVRARVELPWELRCVFDYNSDIIDIDVIKTVAQRAGQIVGLLDYRVEKKGWFGRFEVGSISTNK